MFVDLHEPRGDRSAFSAVVTGASSFVRKGSDRSAACTYRSYCQRFAMISR
ncbi:hypothetical protein DSM3645_12866 [Blastopirellula marina DSM 3645]|uniref:Uncharacterized protein n=1 Tax=Blastopirellula marina DSM 3645 TaxID=314230 RepID=A3ZRZ0_9BACT|nr:hypothetical protein DSM3645_12866 [Blastopirellula marina DSM 3645]